MKLHPYLVFRFELYALQKWFKHLIPEEQNFTPFIEMKVFLEKYCPSPYWNTISFTLDELQAPTKREKILYLASLGLTSREIQKHASASPNTIQTIVKTPRNLRHYQPDNDLDKLLIEWEKLKEKLPQEIFIKYL